MAATHCRLLTRFKSRSGWYSCVWCRYLWQCQCIWNVKWRCNMAVQWSHCLFKIWCSFNWFLAGVALSEDQRKGAGSTSGQSFRHLVGSWHGPRARCQSRRSVRVEISSGKAMQAGERSKRFPFRTDDQWEFTWNCSAQCIEIIRWYYDCVYSTHR